MRLRYTRKGWYRLAGSYRDGWTAPGYSVGTVNDIWVGPYSDGATACREAREAARIVSAARAVLGYRTKEIPTFPSGYGAEIARQR